MPLVGRMERLYASGLGLMIYSPLAVEGLRDGEDYMSTGEPLGEPLKSLVEQQRVVMLRTGSPQLDYDIEVHAGTPSPGSTVGASTRFGLRIEGERLCVRDGYDPMEWRRRTEELRSLPVTDGYYAVDAVWVPGDEDGVMQIALYLSASNAFVSGSGWPQLLYKAR